MMKLKFPKNIFHIKNQTQISTFYHANSKSLLNLTITNTISKAFSASSRTNITDTIMKNFHPSQSKTMDEGLIIVDENDNQVSTTTKINAHLKIANNKYPHRAFSVFLFNSKNELLIQKRSEMKVTFANLWSNTCCSHPIDIDEEKVIDKNIGIKRAAVRRMKFEFGVCTRVEDYSPFEKILYRADSDEIFEEFELDYILLSKLKKDFSVDFLKEVMNTDEVSDVRYISKADLLREVDIGLIKVTPWFKLIIQNRFEEIFKHLESNINIVDHEILLKKEKMEDIKLKTIRFI